MPVMLIQLSCKDEIRLLKEKQKLLPDPIQVYSAYILVLRVIMEPKRYSQQSKVALRGHVQPADHGHTRHCPQWTATDAAGLWCWKIYSSSDVLARRPQ